MGKLHFSMDEQTTPAVPTPEVEPEVVAAPEEVSAPAVEEEVTA